MRAAFAILALIAALSAAHAFGLGEGNQFSRLGAISKGGGGATTGCSNKLDFSQACNSQYLL